MIKYSRSGYWTQILNVENILESREVFFTNRFRDKKILHIGCVGGQLFNPTDNLHLNLRKEGLDVHGMDIVPLTQIAKHCDGPLFQSLDDCNEQYDVVLVPEVLEHVDNCREFLDRLLHLRTRQFFITVPNCEGLTTNFNYKYPLAYEAVHPEHYYWFSAYTLFNITRKYIPDLSKSSMFYLNKKASVAIEFIK